MTKIIDSRVILGLRLEVILGDVRFVIANLSSHL